MAQTSKKRRKRGVILTLAGHHRLQQAIQSAEVNELDQQRYTLERLGDRIGLDPKTIAKVLDRQVGLDKGSLERCFKAFDLEFSSQDYCQPSSHVQSHRSDWGDAVDTSIFFGRKRELRVLQDWLLVDRCRLVALLGLGGVGKTALSVKLAKQIEHQYDWVIWRSLRNGPPLTEFLGDVLQVLSPGAKPAALVSQLLGILKQRRCLLILDNWETVLSDGAGQYQAIAGLHYPHHQGYGELLRQLAEVHHQSTVVITSREKPAEVAMLEGDALPIRSFAVGGLSVGASIELLTVKGVSLKSAEGQHLWQRYEGHPLGLKMVATAIADIFAGDVGAFLSENVEVFNGLRILLKQQIQRLSAQEKQVITWLAIYREPISITGLRQWLLTPPTTAHLLEILESLKRRSLCVSRSGSPPQFTLQPVIRDYVTVQLVEQVTVELQSQERPSSSTYLNRFGLYLASASEQIQAAQAQVILKPIINALLEQGALNLAAHLREQLAQVQTHCAHMPGYQAGNLINLLNYLAAPLDGLDLSGLCIWQANLQQVPLHEVNLSETHVQGSQFATTFFAITDICPLSDPSPPLATAHFQGQILLWDQAGKIVSGFQGGESNVWTLAYSPQGQSLASGSEDGRIHVWDLALRQLQRRLQNSSSIYALQWLHEGQKLLSGDAAGYVQFWDLEQNTCHGWQAHEQGIWSLELNHDQTLVATGSDDKTVKLWTLSGQQLHTLKGHQDWVRCIAFSPTQSLLATGSCDTTIRLWNTNEGQCLRIIDHHQGAVFALAFTLDGQQIISGSADQTVGIFDVDSGQQVRSLSGHRSSIYALRLDPSGHLYSGGDDAQLRIWSLTTGTTLKTITSYIDGITAIVPSQDYLATASMDGGVRVWTLASGEYHTLRGHYDRIYGLAINPEHTIVASASSDHTVRLWSMASGRCQRIFTHHSANVPAVSFHPTAPILATGSWDCTLQLWHLDSGQHLQTLEDHFVQSIAFSPDGQWLAVGTFDAAVKLWDWQQGQVVRQFEGHDQWAWFTVFSPEGHRLASAGGDHTCRIWEVETGRCLQVLTGHTDWVMCPAFSPNGTMLATASKDGTVRLWSVESGHCLAIFPDHGSWVGAVAFSLDGQTLWSSSAAFKLMQWDVQQQTCLATWQGRCLYEGLEMTNLQGLSTVQQQMMQSLGAFERDTDAI